MATHLAEAAALAARLGTEVGTWANLWFGATNVGVWKTSIALEFREHGQTRQTTKMVLPALLARSVRQAEFWAEVDRPLAAGKKTRQQAVLLLLRAEHLAPQRIRHDIFVHEAVADLLRQARRDAGSCVAWPGEWGSPRPGEPHSDRPPAQDELVATYHQ
jgi:hypothetical protein